MKKLLTLAVWALLCPEADAQAVALQNASLTMGNVIEVSFPGYASTVSMKFTKPEDFINGIEVSTFKIKIRTNRKFEVTVAPASDEFEYTGEAVTDTMPRVSDMLQVGIEDNHTGGLIAANKQEQPQEWQNLDMEGSALALLNDCQPGNDQTFTVKYKATPGKNLDAGNYIAALVYTATLQ